MEGSRGSSGAEHRRRLYPDNFWSNQAAVQRFLVRAERVQEASDVPSDARPSVVPLRRFLRETRRKDPDQPSLWLCATKWTRVRPMRCKAGFRPRECGAGAVLRDAGRRGAVHPSSRHPGPAGSPPPPLPPRPPPPRPPAPRASPRRSAPGAAAPARGATPATRRRSRADHPRRGRAGSRSRARGTRLARSGSKRASGTIKATVPGSSRRGPAWPKPVGRIRHPHFLSRARQTMDCVDVRTTTLDALEPSNLADVMRLGVPTRAGSYSMRLRNIL
jgi:hypothetical protein